MKRACRFPRLLPLLALLPLAVATQACSNYSYIDLDIKLGSGFNTVTISQHRGLPHVRDRCGDR